jgi:formate C-acetyltransferase
MFTDKSKKEKLLSIIRTYFNKGGQEMQINSVSRDILTDAMNNPEKYASLVVRVSGFSAFYTSLPKEVQQDILNRTEQG